MCAFLTRARLPPGPGYPDQNLLNVVTHAQRDSWFLGCNRQQLVQWLQPDEKLAPDAVRRRYWVANQFIRAAVRAKLISENPFADLECHVRTIRERDHFITRGDAA